MAARRSVFVAGALANKAGSGGEAWVRMSWVRGFEALGYEVHFVEQLDREAERASAEVEWFTAVAERFGIASHASLLGPRGAIVGPEAAELVPIARDSALVNISGHLRPSPLFEAFRRRVLVDIDPGFTQFWHAEGLAGARVEGHDAFFTIGELIGTPGCAVPTSGIEWQPARQPVVLGDWEPRSDPGNGRLTTIATWRGPFGSVEHAGRTYGLKVHEFRRFIELPARSSHPFELALDIHPGDDADLEALRAHGWRISDPRRAAGDPDLFRAYVQSSAAEFSVAQGVYVDTGCGWFSDRTARYLASGRPALVQETGFSRTLPTGDGLIPFRTLDEAVAGADDIFERYEEHSRAARGIAETHLAAEVVLGDFCERAEV